MLRLRLRHLRLQAYLKLNNYAPVAESGIRMALKKPGLSDV